MTTTETVAAIPEGYTPWNGGDCPKDAQGKPVSVIFRKGRRGDAPNGLHNDCWEHYGEGTDIIAYRIEAALQPTAGEEPDLRHAWMVVDKEGMPVFSAAWSEAAHEHINDAINGGDEDAGRWVVREYVPIASGNHARRLESRPQPAVSQLIEAARYGWQHASWNLSDVEIGIGERFGRVKPAAASQSAVWFIDVDGQRWQVSGPETDEFRAIVRELSAVARNGGEVPASIEVDIEQIGACTLDIRDGRAYMPAITVMGIVSKSCLKPTPPGEVDEAMVERVVAAFGDGDGFTPYDRDKGKWDEKKRAALAAAGMGQATQIIGWIHEDELPENYPYAAMSPHSKVDGVRLFPVFAPGALPPTAAGVPEGWREFIEECAKTAGGEVCGNNLASRAKALLAAAAQSESKADCDECKGAGYTVTPGGVSDTCPNGCQPEPADGDYQCRAHACRRKKAEMQAEIDRLRGPAEAMAEAIPVGEVQAPSNAPATAWLYQGRNLPHGMKLYASAQPVASSPIIESPLYHAANKLLARIASDGEVSSRARQVDDLSDALRDIDGGEYRQAITGADHGR
jgi:hypothetical protein